MTSSSKNVPVRVISSWYRSKTNEEIVSTFIFHARSHKEFDSTTLSENATISGLNGVSVQQYSDGSLLPSYEDISKFTIVPQELMEKSCGDDFFR